MKTIKVGSEVKRITGDKGLVLDIKEAGESFESKHNIFVMWEHGVSWVKQDNIRAI